MIEFGERRKASTTLPIEGVEPGDEDVDLHGGGHVDDVESATLPDGIRNRLARDIAIGLDRIDEGADIGLAKIGHHVDVVRGARLAVH